MIDQRHQVQFSVGLCSAIDYFLASLQSKEKVILVGHNLGGLSLSITHRFLEKVSTAVFVNAVMPGPNPTYVTLIPTYLIGLKFFYSTL